MGVVARTSLGAPPPSSPLPSTEASTLSSAHATSGGPQLSADPGWLSDQGVAAVAVGMTLARRLLTCPVTGCLSLFSA